MYCFCWASVQNNDIKQAPNKNTTTQPQTSNVKENVPPPYSNSTPQTNNQSSVLDYYNPSNTHQPLAPGIMKVEQPVPLYRHQQEPQPAYDYNYQQNEPLPAYSYNQNVPQSQQFYNPQTVPQQAQYVQPNNVPLYYNNYNQNYG